MSDDTGTSSATPLNPEPSEWVTLISSEIDQGTAVQRLGIPSEFAAHALDLDEMPRMKSGPSGTLIVLRLPVSQGGQAREPWVTQPIALVVMPGRIVAISRATHPVLDRIADFARADARHQPRLILRVLELCAEVFLHEVRRINVRVDELEAGLKASLGNREVLELLKCQRGLVYFATALRATEFLLERLQTSNLLRAAPEDHELLEDVRVEIRQALDMTQTSADILSQMMDAFASIISNNLNSVMKFLTAVTIILMVPTLVASLWGMNVGLPLAGHPMAFTGLVLASIALSGLVTAALALRRWL